MSMTRLCVFSSNCSRDFLSTCGDRSTVQRCVFVGSGMGPETCAPVFSAVRTMSDAAWSITAWSNAFRRIRILPAIDSPELGVRSWERSRENSQLSTPNSQRSLSEDLRHDASAHRATTLADGEAELLF